MNTENTVPRGTILAGQNKNLRRDPSVYKVTKGTIEYTLSVYTFEKGYPCL